MTLNVYRRRDRRHTPKVQIFLDGVDVSNKCQRYDGRLRRVWMFDRDAQGHIIADRSVGEIVGRWHYGRVKMRRRLHVV